MVNVVKTKRKPKSRWARFVASRLAIIAEWTDEGWSVDRIVWALSVDLGQIRLLQAMIATRRSRRKKAA